MAQLEARLARVHAPLEERLQTYEKRIAELESDLAARNAENRELIEAKIHLAREKLAAERNTELRESPRRHGEHRETSSSSS
jgi:cytochrome c-type biogenesis protein CcmH/NrfG